MFGFSLRAAFPALVVLSLVGCEAELEENEEETGVELIGEEGMETSPGTFELGPGGAVDVEVEDGGPVSTDVVPTDTI